MASSARWGGQAAFTAAKQGIKGSKIVNNLGRNIAIWLVIGVALMALFNLFQSPASTQSANKIAYSDFIASARNGGITEVLIEGNNLKGRTRENTTVISYMPDGADVVSMLADTDVRIDARPDESNMPGFLSVLISGSRCCYLSGCGFSLCARCRAVAVAGRWALAKAGQRC